MFWCVVEMYLSAEQHIDFTGQSVTNLCGEKKLFLRHFEKM